MAAHSSVLAWRIPGTGEPGGLPSMGSHSQPRLKQLSSSSRSSTSKTIVFYFFWICLLVSLKVYMHIYSNFNHKLIWLETGKISLNQKKVKRTVIHPQNGMLIGNKMNKLLINTRMCINLKYIILWEKSIFKRVQNKTRVPTLTTTIQHSVGSVGHSSQSRKRSKRNPDRKRSETLAVCRWHDPLHRKP